MGFFLPLPKPGEIHNRDKKEYTVILCSDNIFRSDVELLLELEIQKSLDFSNS